MVVRRAVAAEDRVAVSGGMPLLYRALVPLSVEQHGDLSIMEGRDYRFAANANAIPLLLDEFTQAMRHYPIVFTSGEAPQPVALVGLAAGRNDHVDAQGGWSPGTYVPAYVRRYPFILLKEAEAGTRELLCADLGSIQFTTRPGEGERLFADGAPSPRLEAVLDFCKRFEVGRRRTRALMEEIGGLGIVGPAAVEVSRAGRKSSIQGFSGIAEERVRALPDEILAGLARRGVLNLFAAHYMSLANFSDLGAG